MIQLGMAAKNEVHFDEIQEAVIKVLGAERVVDLRVDELTNADGERVLKTLVVYDADQGLTVAEMDDIHDRIWPGDGPEQLPFPIIDFREHTDIEPVAAE